MRSNAQRRLALPPGGMSSQFNGAVRSKAQLVLTPRLQQVSKPVLGHVLLLRKNRNSTEATPTKSKLFFLVHSLFTARQVEPWPG